MRSHLDALALLVQAAILVMKGEPSKLIVVVVDPDHMGAGMPCDLPHWPANTTADILPDNHESAMLHV